MIVNPSTIQTDYRLTLLNVAQSPYASLKLENFLFPYWTVSFVLEGEVESITSGHSKRVRSGDVMIHPPHVPFSELSDTAGTHQWLAFQAELSPGMELLNFYPLPLVLSLDSKESFSAVFTELLQSWEDVSQPFRDVIASAHAYRLLGILLEQWHRMGRPQRPLDIGAESDRFAVAVRYMAEHAHEKITRDELASLLHLHPVYFDRVFQDRYGVTPMRMLRNLRLQRAKLLLESGNESMHSIALICGLGDASYFNRAFRKKYGRTPGEYREEARRARTTYMQ